LTNIIQSRELAHSMLIVNTGTPLFNSYHLHVDTVFKSWFWLWLEKPVCVDRLVSSMWRLFYGSFLLLLCVGCWLPSLYSWPRLSIICNRSKALNEPVSVVYNRL
jgi:hypothetical protein